MMNWQTCLYRISSILAGLACVGAITVSAASPHDSNWPQWRGPFGTGIAPTANPPVTWSETQNVRWKVKLPGRGTATPVIWDNQIFIQTAIPTGKKVASAANQVSPVPAAERSDQRTPSTPRRGGGGGSLSTGKPSESYQFVLLSLDRQTGKILWQQIAREEVPHEGHHRDHGYASYSPVTDGKQVFAFFGTRGLHCYDLQGNKKWEKDLGRYQAKMEFGEGTTPALFGRTLVVNWDHEGEDFIAAWDTESGQELWRQPRDEETSWATPLFVQHQGQTQVVTAATRKIRSYDLATGKLLWECAGLTPNVIPSPVAGEGMIYATSGFRGNALLAIRLGHTGDLTGSDAIAWSLKKSTPYVPSPLYYEGRIYFLANNNGILSICDAKTGRLLVNAERLPDLPGVYASPVGANGRIYLTGRDGASVVIKSSDKLEILATNRLDESFDASPAVVGQELFLRGKEYLYCLGEP